MFLDIILDLTFNKYDNDKWNESRQYEKIKMKLLSNNEAISEEIDNEQVTIYENPIERLIYVAILNLINNLEKAVI